MKLLPKELRRRARAALDGKYFFAVNLTISMSLFTFALSLLLQSSSLPASDSIVNQALYWVLYGIILLLNALIETGLIRFLYGLCQNKLIRERGILFYAFKNQPDTFILTYAFRYLISLIWFVPALYYYLKIPMVIDLAAIPADLFTNLGRAVLLALAGLIPAVLLAIPYSLAVYVQLDHPNCSAREALRESRRLLRGSHCRVLRLWIGFLPLCLLGLGTLGAAFLWIRPYFHASMAQLYLELRHLFLSQQPFRLPDTLCHFHTERTALLTAAATRTVRARCRQRPIMLLQRSRNLLLHHG